MNLKPCLGILEGHARFRGGSDLYHEEVMEMAKQCHFETRWSHRGQPGPSPHTSNTLTGRDPDWAEYGCERPLPKSRSSWLELPFSSTPYSTRQRRARYGRSFAGSYRIFFAVNEDDKVVTNSQDSAMSASKTPYSRSESMATLGSSIRLALHYGEEHLGVTDVFGEDVGPPLGGVFTATQGLKTAWNSPLDERGIVGTAMGIAYAGGRPVFEIQFCDYAFNIIDLLKVAGNQRWAGAGTFDMPIVMMTPTGAGIRGSMYHSHSYESWASRVPGWKIVMPSDALDAYGLMLSAIVDPNPVMMLLPKALLRVRGEQLIPGEPDDPAELSRRIDAPVGNRTNWAPDWPDVQEHFIPIGVGELMRERRIGDGHQLWTNVAVVRAGRGPIAKERRPGVRRDRSRAASSPTTGG